MTSRTRQNISNPTDLIWNPLRWLFQARPISLNPELDTRKFIAEFELKVNANHPNFVDRSYQSAVALAYRESKFLLVYIHSPMHEDTEKFCNQVLCSQNVIRFLDNNLITWAGRIWDPEAYSLSSQLRASTFPFVALLVCQSERVVHVADRFQGFIDERGLLERIQSGMLMYGNMLNQMRTESTRREEANMLRAQQDLEYQQAAEADRLASERRRQERLEREAYEEEMRQQAELEEAISLSTKLTHEARIKNLRESLAPEPPAGEDVATIRFQLPGSSKITRRFIKTSTIHHIHDFLAVHFNDIGSTVRNFSISTHFPKQELTDLTQTIDEVGGLYPRGMLYVTDLDA